MPESLERRLKKRSWQDNAKTVELYHLHRILEYKNKIWTDGQVWSARRTAIELNRGVGSVSEDLKLSLALRIYPEVDEFKTKSEALEYLRRKGKCASYVCHQWTSFEIEEIIKALREDLK